MTATTAPRLVGIDLGTTNSAVAWVDARAAAPGRPRLFEIPQLVAAGEIAARSVLPSFLYLPEPAEIETGAWSLPWDAEPDAVAGVHARDQGALVPARLVSSAKSWLSNPSVDRRAALLPWAQEPPRRLSPVDASTRLLAHLRDAWNHDQARGDGDLRLERQTIVLTVPASFDEEARELTVEAARAAGFTDLTLIEEPLAALYAWMAAHRRDLAARPPRGQTILVCDVGGGTTDFSLFRADADDEGVRFERTAIGEHLLLGGDNVDLAIAAAVERRLAGDSGGPALTLTQRQALRRQCSAAKERLMADRGPEHVPIAVLGAGRGVVAGTRTADLTRTEVERVLDDFLPVCARGDRPSRERRHGLRELGLPYESDPAITKHLAAFLARASRAGATTAGDTDMARPDAVLFNGGFFTPPRARERILDALAEWFGERPAELSNDRPEAAVAIGAAFFAGLRRNPEAARRLLVRAGSARTYYIGVHGAGEGAQSGALCIMPRGTQEGTRLTIDRTFTVTSNQPAAFTLYSSIERADPAGALVTDRDDLHRHAPLVTALSYGKRSRRVPIEVGLSILFSEVGTLEIWCESRTSDHRWRLQFNLRGTDREDDALGEQPDRETGEAEGQVGVDDEAVEAAEQLIRDVFASGAGGSGPEALVGALERALGHGKHAWPLPVIRRLADALLAAAEGRRASARHEARWLNLTGFCARPGFGTTLDPWRITQLRAIYATDLVYPREVQNQVEWLILWQRVAGGFTAAQQQELARKVSGLLGLGARKGPHLNPQVAREAWRLLGSLERLDAAQRAKIGNELAVRVRRDPRNAALVWALGRLGARVPFHGPLNAVVPPAEAQRWMETLLSAKTITADIAAAVGQIGARTGDPARDIDDEARQAAVARLDAADVPRDVWLPLREIVAPDRLDAVRTFGETLPEGLRLEKESGVRS